MIQGRILHLPAMVPLGPQGQDEASGERQRDAQVEHGTRQGAGPLPEPARQVRPDETTWFGWAQPRRAASIFATSIFFIVIIASYARLASAPPAASASVSVRGVICQ